MTTPRCLTCARETAERMLTDRLEEVCEYFDIKRSRDHLILRFVDSIRDIGSLVESNVTEGPECEKHGPTREDYR